MPYTQDDERRMGQIADATLAGDIAELAKMLADQNLIAGLMVGKDRPSEPDFEARLELLVCHLDYVLDVAKDRLHKA